jgi:D-amino-acid dehydrogenase
MRVLVVGAGVQGIANAYYLNKYGLDVTVVDAEASVAMACSHANGGGLTPSAAAPWNDPGIFQMMLKYLGRKDAPMMFRLKALPSLTIWGLKFLSYARQSIFIENTIRNTRLCRYSLRMLEEIDTEIGIDYGVTDSGLLMIFREEAAQEGLEAFAGLLGDEGFEYDSLDSGETIAREPALKPITNKITGSMYCAADRSADPHQFCEQMENYTAQRGVTYRYNMPITGLAKLGSSFHATSASGEVLEADAIVIAAGCYSPKLGKMLGVSIPVKPAKGYSLSIPIEDWAEKPKTLVADMSLHAGLNPIGGKILRVAGTAEFAGYDHNLTEERINNLTGLVDAVFPEFAATMDRDNLKPWAGLRPMSVDSVGIIGKTKVDNLYVSTGHGHLGWTTAAGSGRLVADIMTDKTPELSVQDYAISRF